MYINLFWYTILYNGQIYSEENRRMSIIDKDGSKNVSEIDNYVPVIDRFVAYNKFSFGPIIRYWNSTIDWNKQSFYP